MREAQEQDAWRRLKRKYQNEPCSFVTFGAVTLNLSMPCIVLGGRNGAGKSRVLRDLNAHLGKQSVYLDLHHLCEQALIVLRSRSDFDDMKNEFAPFGPEDDRRNDVQRIVGRRYDNVDWYALEVQPSDDQVAERFRWGGEQALVPYFDVMHRGIPYNSVAMGLGEFSVHFLFWILEQYRGSNDLTLLLDEPDAYLPSIGISALLNRILAICLKRGWRVVISTHSPETIRRSVNEGAFVLLRTNDAGTAVAVHSVDDSTAADELLAKPPIRYVFFVEDESARIFTEVLVETLDRSIARSSSFVWVNGESRLNELRKSLPKPPQSSIKCVYVFDGDMRANLQISGSDRWPALCLPTDRNPDDLFAEARLHVPELSKCLRVPSAEMTRFIDRAEGYDGHDWVNELGTLYGRQRVLRVLAELWVDHNRHDVELFMSIIQAALGSD